MRVFRAAAMVALLAGPAHGQSKAPATLEEMVNSKATQEQMDKEQANERAYKESLKKIPDSKAPSDPWGNARGADATKAAAKTPAVKPQTKSGSTAKPN